MRIKAFVKKVLLALGYSLHKTYIPPNAEYFNYTRFLNCYLERHDDVFLIQIGANDGVTFDPIREFVIANRHRVKGILLEPMKDAYTKLLDSYKDFPELIMENLAIHNTEKEMTLYKVDPDKADKLSLWSGGMASFNPSHHELSNTPKDYIIQERVDCISLNALLDKHNVNKVDILQIDTEGYDAEIILNIDFDLIRPAVIRFEHGYMDSVMDKSKLENIIKYLNSRGYQVVIESYDATAYQVFEFI